MSLQVWLPLNGTTKSQGVKEIQISNHGATVDSTGGILGSCYSFTGTANQYLEFDRPMGAYYNNDFSWTIWVYPTTAKRGILLSEWDGTSDTGSGNVAFELTATLQVRIYWDGNPNIVTTYTLPLNTWTHIAVTKTSNQILIYINGELNFTHNQPNGFSVRKSSKIARIGDDYRSGTLVDFAGKLNDFRIYDHALSATEVREISRGLVCHYKMDDDSFGYYVDSSGYGNHMNITGTPTLTDSTVKYTNCTHFKNGDYLISPTKSNSGWLPTVQLTVNLWMKFTTWGNPISCTESGGFNFENGGSSNGLQFPNYINGVGYRVAVSHVPVSSLRDDWHMLTGTFDGATVRIYIDGELKGSVDTGSTNGIKYANAPLVLSAEANNTSAQSSTMVGELSDVRIYGTALSDSDIMQLYEVRAKITNTGEFHNYELVENTTAATTSVKNTGVAIATADGINENMLKTVPKLVSPTQYNAYQLAFTENLVAGQTYTLQLWDVDVSHTGKTEAQLGVWVYWGGGSTYIFSWSGTSNFTNGHADYLAKTFTVTSSKASGSGAGNPWFNIYNSVLYVAGTMNMRIGKWKLEKGSIPTSYVDDPTYSGYLGVNHGFIENDLLPRNSVATKIHKGYIETKEFIED